MNKWQRVASVLTWKWDASHLIKIWVVNPGLNTLTADESSCMTIKGWYSSWPQWPPVRSFNTTLFWSSLGLKCKAISASETARPICQIRWKNVENECLLLMRFLLFTVIWRTDYDLNWDKIDLNRRLIEKSLWILFKRKNVLVPPAYLFVNWGWIVPRPHASWLDKIMNCLH